MAKFAIIKTGGKQYKVKVSDVLKVEKISEQKKIVFEDLLGGKKVTASILEQIKIPKVRIVKFHPKKRYKRIKGHRQNLSIIKIEKISK